MKATFNARAVAAWSLACVTIVLFTSNPAYKALVLIATVAVLMTTAGFRRMRRVLAGVALVATFDVLLNFVSAHLGRSVLFSLPDAMPGLGGPYTVEALAYGASGGMTIAAAILATAPFSIVLNPQDVMDALPSALSRTGLAISASMSLAPSVMTAFTEVTEAQRLRGWKPRGPRSWSEVVVPVVLTSTERSIQLAESMEARGFGSGPRTTFRTAGLDRGAWTVAIASVAAASGFIAVHAAGWAADWYPYPSLTAPAVDPRAVALCLLLLAPVLVWRRRD